MSRLFRIFIQLSCCLLLTQNIFAQTYLETYGQNRVQHRKFSWRYYETEHFRIYHYDAAGRQLARYIAEQAETDIAIVEKKLGGQFPKSFKIILYNNYDDYQQTNVGKKDDSQLQELPSGRLNLAGDRLVVYFTGVHSDMRRQLRMGMSKVVMQRLLFGDSFKEMAKNALTLNLPEWVTTGYIAYMVDGWNTASENEWKNLLAAYPRKGFYELGNEYPEIAGKAFWKYISERYGENLIRNMLYTMEMKGGLNDGIKLTLGEKVKIAYKSCMNFYRDYYSLQAIAHEQPDSNKRVLSIPVPNDGGKIISVYVSPRGHDVAYMWYKDGEYKIYLQNTRNAQTKKVLLAGGRKDYNETKPDDDYPSLAWSNNGYKLAMLYRKGRETRLRIYNSLKAKIETYIIPERRFERITGLTFMENDEKIVFSAIKRSQSDLYEYTIRRKRVKNITKDAWDDAQPWFVSGGSRRGVLWLSNRPAPNLDVPIGVNELPVGPMNVFFYDTKTERKELLQCSNITKGNASQPIQFGSDNFAYIYDSNGIRNRYVVLFGRDQNNMDSAMSIPVTDYAYGILDHQYNPASNDVADVIQEGSHINIYVKDLYIPDISEEKTLKPAPLTVVKQPIIPLAKAPASTNDQVITLPESNYDNGFSNIKELKIPEGEPVLKKGDVFLSEFDDEDDNTNEYDTTDAQTTRLNRQIARDKERLRKLAQEKRTKEIADSLAAIPTVDSSYVKMRSYPYRLSFRPDKITARLDNSMLFQKYQSVSQTGGSFNTLPVGGLLSVSLNDVMENHKVTAGIRLPFSYPPNLTYFVQYENFTNRLDWGAMIYRSEVKSAEIVDFYTPGGALAFTNVYPTKLTTNILDLSLGYALDRRRSIRFRHDLRQDIHQVQAIDTSSLSRLPSTKEYWSMSHLEYVFDNSIKPELNITKGYQYKVYAEYILGLSSTNKGGMYALGTDFRYYHPIYKNIILASRFAGAHSAGKKKIIYYSGGVDNWLNKKMGNPAQSSSGEYAFTMLATNLRGYKYMEFTGNTFGVINEEIRFPILTTFIKRPIKSGLLRNLQMIAFTDIGGSWFGLVPNKSNNIGTQLASTAYGYTSYNIPGKTGVGMGYGAGLRSTLLGYFLRVDAAWNIEGSTQPIWYISMGTDF